MDMGRIAHRTQTRPPSHLLVILSLVRSFSNVYYMVDIVNGHHNP